MIRLLPRFFNENLGRVSCADRLKQRAAAITVIRSRMDFFIILITKKGLDSFVLPAKIGEHSRNSQKINDPCDNDQFPCKPPLCTTSNRLPTGKKLFAIKAKMP